MNRHHTLLLILAFQALSLPFTTLQAQTSSMKQGPDRILIEAQKQINKDIGQINEMNRQTKAAAEPLNQEFIRQTQKLDDPSLNWEERENANALALHAYTKINQMAVTKTNSSLERLDQVDSQLRRVDQAFAQGDVDREQARELRESIAKETASAIENETQTMTVLGVLPEAPSEEAKAELNAAQALLWGSQQAAEQLRKAGQGQDIRGQFRDLRRPVTGYRNQLVQMREVAQSNLHSSKVAGFGGIARTVVRNVRQGLDTIATPEDPLALEVLRPGAAVKLMNPHAGHQYNSESGSGTGSGTTTLRSFSERFVNN